MNRFLKYYFLSFCISVLVFCGVLLAFLSATNELSISSASNIETSEDILWGTAFDQGITPYKFRRTVFTRPDVLITGSSRVSQVRAQMYPNTRFYNAGLAFNIDNGREFLRRTIARNPLKVLVFGLDIWWFTDKRAAPTAEAPDTVAVAEGEFANSFGFEFRNLVLGALKSGADPAILRRLLAGEIDRTKDPVSGRRPVGYHATAFGSGFRPDGSRQRGELILDIDLKGRGKGFGPRYDFRVYRKAAAAANGAFDVSTGISDRKISLLAGMLEFARGNGIDVVLYFPPLAGPVVESMRQNTRLSQYERALAERIAKTAKKFGATFYNFHDMKPYNIPDNWFYDGIHGNEFVNLAVHKQIIESTPSLSSIVELDLLPAMPKDLSAVKTVDRLFR